MKLIRFARGEKIGSGILEGNLIREIRGSFFEAYEPTENVFALEDVRLATPVVPSKIICVGLNYREHIREINQKIPEYPSHFLKPPSSVIGPNQPIRYPKIAKRVDYEGELAVVIKDRIKDVPQSAALNHVLGYTCFNDVTERSLTGLQGQLTRAKGFDTFSAFGPCVETDLDPFNTTVQTYLNGELVQDGNTSDLMFPVDFLIHYISQCMTLFPGDIISSGTPKGVRAIRPGDVVEVKIDGIGTLSNPVEDDTTETG